MATIPSKNNTKGRPTKVDHEINKLKKDPYAVPPEIVKAIGDFHLLKQGNYLYARITKSQRPRGFFGRHIPISHLVWSIHYPSELLEESAKLLYKDGDSMNNTIDNLVSIDYQ